MLTYGAGWLLDTRIGAPHCTGAVPAWAGTDVTYLDDMNAPLRWCVGADPADANELLVKVAVNRGYGVTVTPKATPARVADSIFNGATDDVLVRIMAGALSLPNNFGRGVLLVPGGATAELAFSEAAVRAAGGHSLISVNAAAEYMVAGMTYTAITKAYGDGDGPAAVVIALLAVAQCITSFGPALVAGDFSAAAAAALKCLASNAEDIGRDLASVLAKQFPKVAAEDLGKVAGRVGGHLWQVWAAGLVFGVATWFADQKLDGAAWTLNVFPKALPPPAPSFVGEWYVHGSTLSIESVTSGHEETNVGPCAPLATLHDPTGPMCHERVTYRFTLSADGRALTATVTSVSVVEAGTAISRPEVVATGKVGDSFTLTFVAPNQLIRSPWILGNPYLCNAKTPAQYQNRCGA